MTLREALLRLTQFLRNQFAGFGLTIATPLWLTLVLWTVIVALLFSGFYRLVSAVGGIAETSMDLDYQDRFLSQALLRSLTLQETQIDYVTTLQDRILELRRTVELMSADEPERAEVERLLESLRNTIDNAREEKKSISKDTLALIAESEKRVQAMRDYIEDRFDRELSHM